MNDDMIRLGLLLFAALLAMVLAATWPRKPKGLPPPCRTVNRNRFNDHHEYVQRLWRQS